MLVRYFGTPMEPYWKHLYDGSIETLVTKNSYVDIKQVCLVGCLQSGNDCMHILCMTLCKMWWSLDSLSYNFRNVTKQISK